MIPMAISKSNNELMNLTTPLGTKGKKLLKLLVAEIGKGRFQKNHPETFISYKETLKRLGKRKPHIFPGKRLQREGLTELNEWTMNALAIPKITGLIVNEKKRIPGSGYWPSHGFNNDFKGNKWWLTQTAKAIGFNWSPYL